MALQPYIWNLIEAVVTNIFFEDIYVPTVLEFEDLSGRIDENGAPINMWRNNAYDFTGYRTYYEDAKNLNLDFNEDERIDADGPWHAPALKSFLDPISGTTENMLSAWYSHLNLTDLETAKVSGQLETFTSEINSLSSKIIYNYGVDGFGNHYTLFKDDDEFETPGEMWIRYRNHPLSFPLIDAPATDQVEIPDLTALSADFKKVTQQCFDFGVDYVATQNVLWMYGTNTDIITNPGQSEYILYGPIIETTTSHNVKLERWPSLFVFKQIPRNEYKYVGTYVNENDLVIAKIRKHIASIAASALEEVSGTISTFNANIEWDVQNYYIGNSIVKTKAKNLKYDEYDASTNQTQWRLSKGEDTITIAFESEAPSASVSSLFYGSSNNVNSPFDPNENECSAKIFDNGITVMDFDIGTNTSIGDSTRDPKVSYYYGYTDVTYQGINAFNGIDISGNITTPRDYTVLSGDCEKFQFFGNVSTSGAFTMNTSAGITCFNDISGLFNISLAPGLPTWETFPSTVSSWEQLSTTTWESSATPSWQFTYPGEVFPSGSTTLTSGYSVTYNGTGCHLFEVCYDPQ
jgi:hypothetical protein